MAQLMIISLQEPRHRIPMPWPSLLQDTTNVIISIEQCAHELQDNDPHDYWNFLWAANLSAHVRCACICAVNTRHVRVLHKYRLLMTNMLPTLLKAFPGHLPVNVYAYIWSYTCLYRCIRFGQDKLTWCDCVYPAMFVEAMHARFMTTFLLLCLPPHSG